MDSLTLYREGVPLPDDLKLSKKAVRQVCAIREWAARENKNRQGAFEAELATPTPPQAARVEAVRSACVPPAAQAFVADPATIARAAQLMRGLLAPPQRREPEQSGGATATGTTLQKNAQ